MQAVTAMIGWAAGAGLLTAFAVLNPLLFGQHFSILLMIVGHVPLLYVGMRFGTLAVVSAAGIGAVTLVMAHALLSAVPFEVLGHNSLMYLGRYALPALIAVRVLLVPPSTGALFHTLVVMGVLITAASAYALQGELEALASMLQGTLDDVALQTGQPLPLPDGFVPGIVAVLGGFFGASWLIVFALNLALARLLARRDVPALPPLPVLADLTLAPVIIVLMAVCIAGAVFLQPSTTLGYYAANISVFLTMPYMLVGLGVIHALVADWAQRKIFLWIFYLASIITPYPLLLALAMGIIDPVVNFRRLAARRKE